MKEILAYLIESNATQAMALQAVANHVNALKTVVSGLDPQFAQELTRQISLEQEKTKQQIVDLQQRIAEMREAIRNMAN